MTLETVPGDTLAIAATSRMEICLRSEESETINRHLHFLKLISDDRNIITEIGDLVKDNNVEKI